MQLSQAICLIAKKTGPRCTLLTNRQFRSYSSLFYGWGKDTSWGVQRVQLDNNDNETLSWKGALNRYRPAQGTTLASYWSSIHKTAVHSPHRQSANYKLQYRRPAGSNAVFTSPASRAGETTLSQNHNYDEYGRRFMATPLFLVMWGGREMGIHEE